MATLYIDTKESERLERHLRNYPIMLERRHLEVGDYVIDDIGIELKGLNDLYNSVIDSRIWRQLISLKRTYSRPILLVINELPRGKIPVDQFTRVVFGAIASAIARLGITVFLVPNEPYAARLLYSIYRNLEKKETSRPLPRPKRYLASTQEIRENMLAVIPKLGVKKARLLLKEFGSIKTIASAREEDLRNIKGLGKELPRKILEVLN